jgi:hypothetical protein
MIRILEPQIAQMYADRFGGASGAMTIMWGWDGICEHLRHLRTLPLTDA